jgi:hypothetical protein
MVWLAPVKHDYADVAQKQRGGIEITDCPKSTSFLLRVHTRQKICQQPVQNVNHVIVSVASRRAARARGYTDPKSRAAGGLMVVKIA